METKKLTQIANFVCELTENDGRHTLTIRTVNGSWSMSYSDENSCFTPLLSLIIAVDKHENIKAALDGTIHDIFMVSSVVPHPASLSNDIAEALEKAMSNLRKAVDNVSGDDDDSEEWMEVQDRLDKMLGAAIAEAEAQ